MSDWYTTHIWKNRTSNSVHLNALERFLFSFKRLLKAVTPPGYCILLILSLQLTICPAKAQQPYSLINYNENILHQTTLGNIQQDEDGYLWMNTQFGIVRFDGEKVRVFNTDNIKELSSNRIRLCAKGLFC